MLPALASLYYDTSGSSRPLLVSSQCPADGCGGRRQLERTARLFHRLLRRAARAPRTGPLKIPPLCLLPRAGLRAVSTASAVPPPSSLLGRPDTTSTFCTHHPARSDAAPLLRSSHTHHTAGGPAPLPILPAQRYWHAELLDPVSLRCLFPASIAPFLPSALHPYQTCAMIRK